MRYLLVVSVKDIGWDNDVFDKTTAQFKKTTQNIEKQVLSLHTIFENNGRKGRRFQTAFASFNKHKDKSQSPIIKHTFTPYWNY